MNALLKALGFLLLASVDVLRGDELPPYDEEACFNRTQLMKLASEMADCSWIASIDVADFLKNKTQIMKCFGKKFGGILANGDFNVKQSLLAYDAFAVPEKNQAISDAFNKCNKEGRTIQTMF